MEIFTVFYQDFTNDYQSTKHFLNKESAFEEIETILGKKIEENFIMFIDENLSIEWFPDNIRI